MEGREWIGVSHFLLSTLQFYFLPDPLVPFQGRREKTESRK